MEILHSARDSVEGLVYNYVGCAWRQRDAAARPVEAIPWDEVPLSSFWSPVIGCVLYLTVVHGIQRLLRDREPLHKRFPWIDHALVLHNAFLCLASVVMFYGSAASVLEVYLQRGFWACWADPQWKLPAGKVPFWCYVFYVSKYYELLDTVFLVVKKRPARMVQLWHHTTVLFLFWSYMEARMFNHWVLVVLNCFVHIFVYGYFLATSLGIPIPFKSAITLLQISQFVVDMVYAVPFPYFFYYRLTPGDWTPWVFGQFVGVTFLFLFAEVYVSNRRLARQHGARRRVISPSVLTDMPASGAGKPKAE